MQIVYKEVTAAQIIDLRWAVLRSGRPRASAVFDGDEQARHFAAVTGSASAECTTSTDGKVIACLSLFAQPFVVEAGTGVGISAALAASAWQLRGMACDECFRGQGIGRQLIEQAQTVLSAERARYLLWCNARASAVAFYQKCGWQLESAVFDIPGVGPHYKMSKQHG